MLKQGKLISCCYFLIITFGLDAIAQPFAFIEIYLSH